MTIKFEKINNSIIKCKKCPRLISYSKKFQKTKESKILMKFIGENLCPGLVTLMVN